MTSPNPDQFFPDSGDYTHDWHQNGSDKATSEIDSIVVRIDMMQAQINMLVVTIEQIYGHIDRWLKMAEGNEDDGHED